MKKQKPYVVGYFLYLWATFSLITQAGQGVEFFQRLFDEPKRMLAIFTFVTHPPLWFIPVLLVLGTAWIVGARKWVKSRPFVYISDYEYDIFRQMHYRRKGGDGPYCPQCLEQDRLEMHLQMRYELEKGMSYGNVWKCLRCGNRYQHQDGQIHSTPEKPQGNLPPPRKP